MVLRKADQETRSKLLAFSNSKPDTPGYYLWLQGLKSGDRVKLNGFYANQELMVDKIRHGVIICNADVKFNQTTGFEANRAAAAKKTRSSWVGRP